MASIPEEKFHDELRWCITQLELGLAHQDPDSRQGAETVKVLKILRSSKAPLVKKRQAMRNALGDYRKKMRESEKKFVSGLRNSKFQPVGSIKAYSKSKFLRQSNSRTSDKDELGSHLSNLLLEQKVPEGSQCPDESHDDDDKNVNSLSGRVNLLKGDHEKGVSMYSQNSNGNCSVGSLYSESASSSGPGSVVTNKTDINSQQCVGPSHNNTDKGSEEMFGSSSSTGFHFAPSDNSFCFSFTEEEENVGKETTGAEDGVSDASSNNSKGYKQSGQTENSYQEGGKIKPNVFRHERTDNSFVFNFSLDGDGQS